MQARDILRTKGDAVITITPDRTIAEALAELARHNIGALVVSADGRSVEGILSERDVVRALAADGAPVLERPVGELCSTTVVTCTPETRIDDLMVTMTERRFRHLPVVDDDGALAGIVSIGDVVKWRVSELEETAQHLVDYIRGGR